MSSCVNFSFLLLSKNNVGEASFNKMHICLPHDYFPFFFLTKKLLFILPFSSILNLQQPLLYPSSVLILWHPFPLSTLQLWLMPMFIIHIFNFIIIVILVLRNIKPIDLGLKPCKVSKQILTAFSLKHFHSIENYWGKQQKVFVWKALM